MFNLFPAKEPVLLFPRIALVSERGSGKPELDFFDFVPNTNVILNKSDHINIYRVKSIHILITTVGQKQGQARGQEGSQGHRGQGVTLTPCTDLALASLGAGCFSVLFFFYRVAQNLKVKQRG